MSRSDLKATDSHCIPFKIHQTWKSHVIPATMKVWQDSWHRHCPPPRWEYHLSQDDENRQFIADTYPWFLPIYDAYPENIMRVDAFRYFLLHHQGGVYVDMDFECIAPIEPLIKNHQLILGQEPAEHVLTMKRAGHSIPPDFVGNAWMASTAGHPFWETVFEVLQENAQQHGPLIATGPIMLSWAWQRYQHHQGSEDAKCILLPAVQLYPITLDETQLGQTKQLLQAAIKESRIPVYAVHHWMGSWWRNHSDKPFIQRLIIRSRYASRSLMNAVSDRLRRIWRTMKRLLKSRQKLPPMEELPLVDDATPARPLSTVEKKQHILVAIPVKNGAAFLSLFLHNMARLSYDPKYLHLVFLESDSSDKTWEILNRKKSELQAYYGSVQLYQRNFGYQPEVPRYYQQEQFVRRAILARSRNLLVQQGLSNQDWVLWIDVDVSWWPTQIIECLLAEDKDIIVPNCRNPYGGDFDLNSFKIQAGLDSKFWDQYHLDNLIQPPKGVGRHYLNHFQGQHCVPLDGVGGCMLLVRAALHRQGIVFPEKPYRHYIETEGLAMMAIDHGYTCWGMPDLHIIHPMH